jgi:hypothetical protein
MNEHHQQRQGIPFLEQCPKIAGGQVERFGPDPHMYNPLLVKTAVKLSLWRDIKISICRPWRYQFDIAKQASGATSGTGSPAYQAVCPACPAQIDPSGFAAESNL